MSIYAILRIPQRGTLIADMLMNLCYNTIGNGETSMRITQELLDERLQGIYELQDEMLFFFKGYYFNYRVLLDGPDREEGETIDFFQLDCMINNINKNLKMYYQPIDNEEITALSYDLLKSIILYLEDDIPIIEHTFRSIIKLIDVFDGSEESTYAILIEKYIMNAPVKTPHSEKILLSYQNVLNYKYDVESYKQALKRSLDDYLYRDEIAVVANDHYDYFFDSFYKFISKKQVENHVLF